MAEVRVTVAAPDDWERVRALRLAALADSPDAFGSSLEEERTRAEDAWRAPLRRPRTTTLVAVLELAHGGERDAGLAVVAPWRDRPGEAGLFAVWVAPWARGRGVGEALVSTAIREAARDYRRIVLDVGDDNVAAIRLYERLGFEPTGMTSCFLPPREHITQHECARDLP
jgi:ribosomal protein S18 acetylase RimI-like enzyme